MKKEEKLALLLGMFAGDGCLPIKHNGEGYRNYQIAFYNTNKRYVLLFSSLFNNLFKDCGRVYCRKRKGRLPLWCFEKYSKKLALLFNEKLEMPFGKKALSVFIPSFIKEANHKIKKHFLLGLIMTDGGIRKDGSMIFHCASKQLIDDVNKVIKDIWNINKCTKKYIQGKFTSFQINLNRNESKLVLENMPPWHNLVLRGL